MNCGNDPNARLTPGDEAIVEWFRDWLDWSKRPLGDRSPEPACPDGRAIDIAARAETTVCTQRTSEGETHA